MSEIAQPFAPRVSASLVRVANTPAARRIAAVLVLILAWELAAILQNNPIMLPRFSATVLAAIDAIRSDNIVGAVWVSLSVLLKGYAIALAVTLALVAAAAVNGFARDMLQMLTAMLNPLPAIALLPLALLWFGLGETSIIFVLCHAVVWPLSLAALTGFDTVPPTQRLVGRNYGLSGPKFLALILIPAALPSLLSGLKIGWAFAWRTLIAAELVFGVTSGSGGLGWFIFRNRNDLLTDKVFAGLATVIAIGLLVEILVFRTIEQRTVRRWGMAR
ncbi:ABC transporter permease subunit [Acuticoccus sp. M5D2P5]|uniref:ABC transporter permease n=1 Tax=Acuticoccus kalidii TaxID=2910977 RepID=UPI001F17DC00|nr:ABC transporter permease subunit [Acuticoccus kalidii]MCF3934012.1 ABC transporter permease subunit [Acuticoccus kalidii]